MSTKSGSNNSPSKGDENTGNKGNNNRGSGRVGLEMLQQQPPPPPDSKEDRRKKDGDGGALRAPTSPRNSVADTAPPVGGAPDGGAEAGRFSFILPSPNISSTSTSSSGCGDKIHVRRYERGTIVDICVNKWIAFSLIGLKIYIDSTYEKHLRDKEWQQEGKALEGLRSGVCRRVQNLLLKFLQEQSPDMSFTLPARATRAAIYCYFRGKVGVRVYDLDKQILFFFASSPPPAGFANSENGKSVIHQHQNKLLMGAFEAEEAEGVSWGPDYPIVHQLLTIVKDHDPWRSVREDKRAGRKTDRMMERETEGWIGRKLAPDANHRQAASVDPGPGPSGVGASAAARTAAAAEVTHSGSATTATAGTAKASAAGIPTARTATTATLGTTKMGAAHETAKAGGDGRRTKKQHYADTLAESNPKPPDSEEPQRMAVDASRTGYPLRAEEPTEDVDLSTSLDPLDGAFTMPTTEASAVTATTRPTHEEQVEPLPLETGAVTTLAGSATGTAAAGSLQQLVLQQPGRTVQDQPRLQGLEPQPAAGTVTSVASRAGASAAARSAAATHANHEAAEAKAAHEAAELQEEICALYRKLERAKDEADKAKAEVIVVKDEADKAKAEVIMVKDEMKIKEEDYEDRHCALTTIVMPLLKEQELAKAMTNEENEKEELKQESHHPQTGVTAGRKRKRKTRRGCRAGKKVQALKAAAAAAAAAAAEHSESDLDEL